MCMPFSPAPDDSFGADRKEKKTVSPELLGDSEYSNTFLRYKS